jgi:hypothetical protein
MSPVVMVDMRLMSCRTESTVAVQAESAMFILRMCSSMREIMLSAI